MQHHMQKCAILTSSSEEKWVIITFIFNGRKRNNLYKVICFKFQVYKRLRLHSLQKIQDCTYFKINDHSWKYFSKPPHNFAIKDWNSYIKNPFSTPLFQTDTRNLNPELDVDYYRCAFALHVQNGSSQLQESFYQKEQDLSLKQQLPLISPAVLLGTNLLFYKGMEQ